DVLMVQSVWTMSEVAVLLIYGSVNFAGWELIIIRQPPCEWRTPQTRTGEVLVPRALEPLTKLAIAYVLWHPLNLIVVELHHTVTDCGNFHEPCWHCLIDQRLTGTPRVRVGVLNGDVADDAALGLEITDDVLVGIEY